MNCKLLLALALLCFVLPVSADPAGIIQQTTGAAQPYEIRLFIPTERMIHSTQVTDLISGPGAGEEVIIATSFGLSTYNGSWWTRHMTLQNVSEGLLDDYVTAVEIDRNGSLWIGFPDGLQIYNGRYYRTIQDQQLLKDMNIIDLQRWNDDMWIATGTSAVHRYRDGVWTWYQPGSRGGPGFYQTDSMALDVVHNISLIATRNEGLWILRSQDEPVLFDEIAPPAGTYGLLSSVRRDPAGGVFFFNRSLVAHYDPDTDFRQTLTAADLSVTRPSINDITAGSGGTLYLATDQGIWIWREGQVLRHLDRFEGIGTSGIVQFIRIDAWNRVWFATQDDVGYYRDRTGGQGPIAIETVAGLATTPSVGSVNGSDSPAAPSGVSRGSSSRPPPPTLREVTSVSPTVTPGPSGLGGIIDTIVNAIRGLLGRGT